MSTEKTPLTDSAARAALSYPYYGNDTGVHQFYTRRRKEQQLQCLTFVIVIAVFVMALVVTVSYSINEVDPLVADSTNPEEVPPSPSLTLTGKPSSTSSPSAAVPHLGMSNGIATTLTAAEWNEAVKAGHDAITAREAADALATPLPAPSPDSRHQYAVKTTVQAGRLALAGIGELAATRSVEAARTKLGAPSSVGTYFANVWAPEGTCKEYAKIVCPPTKYRNFDGTCNHPKNAGSALTPFLRMLPPDYADGVEAPRTGKFGSALPSAREISLKVHPPSPSSNPSFTVMLAVFGQFLDHDITATAISQGTNGSSLTCCPAATHQHPECFPVAVSTGDPVYDVAGRDCMEFVRSAPAPQCKIGPRQQLNQVTSFIDGSVIYGPDVATAQSLREGQGGLLRMFKTPDNRTLLPQSTDPNDGCNREVETARGRYCFASGDGRANENLHLTTMHVLWARQHNRIATALAEVNPTWSDEKIYQETRRIIGAQLQHITYREFVPVILGEKEMNLRKLKPMTSGFRPRNASTDVNPAIANEFAASAFRFAHTLLPGLMKVTDAQKSTSSYVELHRMLFNPYSLYSKGGMESSLTSATSNAIQKTTTHVTSQLTKHLFEDPLANATIPCGLDLVSLNIQRGRDHGLPGYTAWRQHCGLGKVASFADLQGHLDPEALSQISKLYDHVDDVDLYTGALAESDKGDGLVGPTFRCIIGDQFARLQQGDRFWYEVPGEPQSFTEEQLKEIRKTTLAKLICDCSDEIYQIQPSVMRSIDPDNPMTSCEDLPEPNLQAWKDASSPVLKAAPAAIPETWLNFKREINQTVQGIVDFFGKTPPAPGSPDWATFKDWINKSFADIRSEISALHPTPAIVTLNEDPPSPYAKKDMSSGKFNYMQFVMNRSLTDLNKYSQTATTQPTTYDDWITFKSDIKKALADALVSVTGMPTAEQRDELKKQITAQIADIKAEITKMKSAKLTFAGETALESEAAAAADWLTFKTDIVKAVTDAVDRVKSNAPPPGDPAWATYGLDIKNQFIGVKKFIPVLPPKKLMAVDPSAAAYWSNFADSLNKTIADAVTDIEGHMPAPGDPAWAAFGSKIKDEFSGIKNIPNLKAKAPKEPKPKDPAIAAYWSSFKDSLNKSINSAVAEIASKSPPPGDPAWAAFGAKIMNDFSAIKDKLAGSKGPVRLQAKVTDDPAIAAFWDDFRTSLNASINGAVADIAGAKAPPPGDPAWAAFGAKIMNDFAGFKDKFAALHDSGTGKTKVKAAGGAEVATFDWFKFKADIIKSIADTVKTIKKNMPPPGSPALAAFKGQVMSGFAEIPSEASTLKLSAAAAPIPPKGGAFDWVAFKDEINKSVADIIDGKLIPANLPPGDPKWADFGAKFAKFNRSFEVIKSEIDALRPKPEESQFAVLKQDWLDFKEKINKSLTETIDLIKSKSPKSGDPGWADFGNSIKSEFAALKNEIDFVKSEASLMAFDNSQKTVEADSAMKTRETQSVPDFSSDLISLQANTNKTFARMKKNIVGAKIGAVATTISAADWIAFKREINDAVAQYVSAFNGTEAEEWMNMKDFVKKSFADLRNEVISLRDKTAAAAAATLQKSGAPKPQVKLQAKKPKDFPKNDQTPFDWDALKSEVNTTVQMLMDDIGKVAPGKTPAKILKDSLLKAQDKFAKLQLSASLTAQSELPSDWAVFVNGVNKTLSGVMKKIGALKPVDTMDLAALKVYEKEVDEFFDEVKDVVDQKKTEFEAAASTGSSVSSVIRTITTIVPVWIIFTFY